METLLDSGNITLAIKKNDLFDLFQKFTNEKQELTDKIKKAETQEVYYSPAEVCKMLGINASTAWRWEKAGYLVGYRIGGKKRYKKSDIDNLTKGGEL